MTETPTRPPRPPDLTRRTLTPFGYAVCILVPIAIAALGFTYLHFHYDKEQLVSGRSIPILTSDWTPDQPGSDALAKGEVTLGDDGCVLVGGETLVWPKGYEATVQRVGIADQVKVYDPSRHIVARSGDTIEVGGGSVPFGDYAGRTCAPASGEVFVINSEVKVVEAG